jgi:hypothetical protein
MSLNCCRAELEVLQDGIQESRLFMQQLQVLCPAPNTLQSPVLVQKLNLAKQALAASLENVSQAEQQLSAAVSACSPLKRPHEACTLPMQPAVFSASLVRAMQQTSHILEECHQVLGDAGGTVIPDLTLPVASEVLTVRHVFPSWKELETLMGKIIEDVGRVQASASHTHAPPPARDHAAIPPVANVEQFAKSVEACLQYTLLWAQEAGKPRLEQNSTSATEAVAVLKACMQSSAIDNLSVALASCAQFAGQLPGSDAEVLGLASQLRGVLHMVRTVLVALRAAIVHAVLLQAAFSQLTLVVIATFVAFVKEGFGEGVSEEQDVPSGAETGMLSEKCLIETCLLVDC